GWWLHLVLAGGVAAVAVIGAGLMGRRLAGLIAAHGFDVTLADTQVSVLPEALEAARAMAGGAGSLTESADILTAVSDVDFVLEAIIEDLDVKQNLFAEISHVNAHAILASNSSVIPITAIAEKASVPQRCVGTHFWNPPDLIPIVEVVRGTHTSDATMDRTVEFLDALGKMPVRVEKDVPGFVGNRLQHALWREAIDLVATGVCDAETVDRVVRNTIGLRLGEMGPIENADYVGLDLTLAIHQAVLPSINADRHPSPYLEQLVAEGNLGAKTGQGFLTWHEGQREAAASRLAEHVQSQLSSQ
ncbi:MAG: hypothetical protein RJB01_1376, partial [Actinomycetota bacterium]